uniref:SMC hinge domain-containing protein n=1 Tax=Romanomermis culicivorax TaxID=13658 RepID=A0A915KEZ3_ROMCU
IRYIQGDLAAIDEKYDVAISTACGPLDNIVVDTIDTAQQCVTFLKKRNLGQATFIGLDKMTKFAETMRQPLETPENVPRLFDLIRVEDESVLPAFYFALRDTLVAPNLDQATRIALQGRVRWRVVTLQGQLLDPSGTMSGGGNKQMKGRMGSSVVAHAGTDMKREDIEKLDKKMEQLSQQLNAKRQKRLELEKNLDQISRDSQKLKVLIDKTATELEASNQEESIINKQIANQEKVLRNTVIDENEKKRLQKRVDELIKEYDHVYQSGEEIRAKVAKYHEKIMEISDRLVGSVQKQLDECRNDLENCRKNITKSNVSVKTAQRNLRKTEEQIEKCQQELKESEVTKQTLKDKRKKLETEGVKVMDAFERAKENAKKLEEDCIAVKKALDSAEELEQQLSKTAMDKKQRLETSESALKEQTHKLNHWRKEIKKLKLNDLRDLKPISNVKKATPVKKVKRRKGKTQKDNENSPSDDLENENKEEIDDSNSDGDDDDDLEQNSAAEEDQQETCSDSRFDEVDLPTPEENALRKMQEKSIVVTLTVDEDNLKSMKPNLGAIDDFRKKLEKYNACVQDLEEVTTFRDKVRLKYDEFRKRRLTEFMTGF